MIDNTDIQILSILQSNARTSNAEIARQVGMAASAVFERIRRLEERGVIEGYTLRVSPAALDLGLTAFMLVRTDDRGVETAGALTAIPEAQEVHHIAGEDCYLLKIRVADTQALAQLMRDRLGPISAITSTRTTIVLETLKETSLLPLPDQFDA